MGKSKLVTKSTRWRGIRVPHKLDQAIAEECRQQNITYSEFVVRALNYVTMPNGEELRLVDEMFDL